MDNHLRAFALDGLRTLMLAMKEVSHQPSHTPTLFSRQPGHKMCIQLSSSRRRSYVGSRAYLCLDVGQVEEAEFEAWFKEWKGACASMQHREEAMGKVAESIEQGLVVVGATAIEDKLQVRRNLGVVES